MITVKLKNLTLNFTFGFFLTLAIVTFFQVKLIKLILIFSLIHELAHIVAMSACGVKETSIKFHLCGIAIIGDCVEVLSKKNKMFVYLSGCVLNLFLTGVFIVVGKYSYSMINLCMCVFNLLPIEGFDGKNIMSLIWE